MVNYDTQDGYSVTSFQSPLPEQLIKSSISSSSRLNALETLEETSSLELLPSSYTASELVHLPQSHHNVHSNGLLVPSTSILSIREVHFKHAGNYTCSPSNARNGTITIHVLRGKNYNNKLYLRLRTHTRIILLYLLAYSNMIICIDFTLLYFIILTNFYPYKNLVHLMPMSTLSHLSYYKILCLVKM